MQTIEGRSSERIRESGDAQTNRETPGDPDQFLIDWGTLPTGTVVNIWWPDGRAHDAVRLANTLNVRADLGAVDANSIECRITSRLTFVPIPHEASAFPGLFRITLPKLTRRSRVFNIIVRHMSTHKIGEGARAFLASGSGPIVPDWHYLVNTYQIVVPVESEKSFLLREESALAILKWRLQSTPQSDRWYAVLKQYVGEVSAAVDAAGGDAALVAPSPEGASDGETSPSTYQEVVGRVCEVIYNGLGAFEGFVLETRSTKRPFRSHDGFLGEFVTRAAQDHLPISVFFDNTAGRIRQLIVGSC